MRDPQHVPFDAGELSAARSNEAVSERFPCSLHLQRGRENSRLLLLEGPESPSQPRPDADGLLVWAPLSGSAAVATARLASDHEGGLASGALYSPLDFLAEVEGPLATLRLLESDAPSRCCGSSLMVELAGATLVFRGAIHRPVPGPAAQLVELRPWYPRRQAGDWAVCEWNARWLDPVEPAGVLFADERLEGAAAPAAYVLWRDVDGVPRAWEKFVDPLLPELLSGALGGQFRYVDRDQEMLVVDRSPARPAIPRRPLTDERVHTAPFSRPPLPESAPA